MVVAVDDDKIANLKNAVDNEEQITEEIDEDGNLVEVFTTTITNTTTTTKPIEFLTLEITDQLNNNKSLSKHKISYYKESFFKTTCGYVYQYQILFDFNIYVEDILLKINMPTSKDALNVFWNLLDFSV